MKAYVKKSLLEKHLNIHNKVLTKDPNHSSTLKLEVIDGVLHLYSTDFNQYLHTYFELDGYDNGQVYLAHERFYNVLHYFPCPDIILELENQTLKILPQNKNILDIAQLKVLNPEGYPAFPTIPEEQSWIIEFNQFQQILQKIQFSMAKEDTRYVLKGLFVQAEENKIYFVSTDSKRMGVYQIDNSAVQDFSMIFPPKLVSLIMSLDFKEQEIYILQNENKVFLQTGQFTLVCQLLEGQYPNFQEVIPKNLEEQVVIPKEVLEKALNHTSSILRNSKQSRIVLKFSPDWLELKAQNEQEGENSSKIPINYSGQEYITALNFNFLGDVLKHMDQQIHIHFFYKTGKSIVIDDGKNYKNIIMPMKI